MSERFTQVVITLFSAALIFGAYFTQRRKKISRTLLFAGIGACLGCVCSILVPVTLTHLIVVYPRIVSPPYDRLVDFALETAPFSCSLAGAVAGGLLGSRYAPRNAA